MTNSLFLLGGIHGASFVAKEHRSKNLFRVMRTEIMLKALSKNEVVIIESGADIPFPFGAVGLSHVIWLHNSVECRL